MKRSGKALHYFKGILQTEFFHERLNTRTDFPEAGLQCLKVFQRHGGDLDVHLKEIFNPVDIDPHCNDLHGGPKSY